ncbi:hypothetical protein FXO37_16758 [Capsicum annuum]|nr:hypothetical protein FXO37_16758 [Capsicum annuum]
MVLESKEELRQIAYDDSSSVWGEDALEEVNSKLRVGNQSNHFSILCLEDVIRIHSSEQWYRNHNPNDRNCGTIVAVNAPRSPYLREVLDYNIYHEEQKKKGATAARLERAYSALVGAHRDLRDVHEKMMKREKKRYKFFKKIWKGVKCIFKVLKPNHRLTSLRLDSEDEAPVDWYADGKVPIENRGKPKVRWKLSLPVCNELLVDATKVEVIVSFKILGKRGGFFLRFNWRRWTINALTDDLNNDLMNYVDGKNTTAAQAIKSATGLWFTCSPRYGKGAIAIGTTMRHYHGHNKYDFKQYKERKE